jgi:hypothetical protein
LGQNQRRHERYSFRKKGRDTIGCHLELGACHIPQEKHGNFVNPIPTESIVTVEMTQVCSKGRRCRARRLAQPLTDHNFRRPAGRNGFFKTCNLCRDKPLTLVPDNPTHPPQRCCSTCGLLQESQYFGQGFPKANICTD